MTHSPHYNDQAAFTSITQHSALQHFSTSASHLTFSITSHHQPTATAWLLKSSTFQPRQRAHSLIHATLTLSTPNLFNTINSQPVQHYQLPTCSTLSTPNLFNTINSQPVQHYQLPTCSTLPTPNLPLSTFSLFLLFFFKQKMSLTFSEYPFLARLGLTESNAGCFDGASWSAESLNQPLSTL
jgi:hypothetical protein